MFLILILSLIGILFLEKWIKSILGVLNSISLSLEYINKSLIALSRRFLFLLGFLELVDKEISSK